MTRTAILSDIHGNLTALEAVLADVDDQNVDRIVCLGDVIGYGPAPRECLDLVIVLNEQHLRRILREYFSYYHTCRTHLSLHKDSPETRPVEPSELDIVLALPCVGGLHHRYARIAA